MSAIEVKKPSTLKMIQATEAKSPAEWEALYPGLWMILEVTAEDEHQVQQARLVATAEDDAEFLELARAYQRSHTAYLITRGNPTEEGPAIVAHA